MKKLRSEIEDVLLARLTDDQSEVRALLAEVEAKMGRTFHNQLDSALNSWVYGLVSQGIALGFEAGLAPTTLLFEEKDEA